MSNKNKLEVTLVDINKVKPNPRNTNQHTPQQIDRLTKILSYQGFRSPIVVSNRSGLIVAGHARLEAAKKLGLKEVPVSYQDFESEQQEFAHLNADNEIARWASLDVDIVKGFEFDVDFDMDLLGIKDVDFLNKQEEKEGNTDEDAVPELSENEFGVKIGDVFQLGNHRVMCGDSTDQETVAKLMDGQKADMVFTDPPYGMNLDTDYSKMPSTKKEGNKSYKKIEGDNEDFKPELITTILENFEYCNEVFIFGADYFAEVIANKNEGSWIVWDKRIEEKFDKMFGSAFELCWSKSKHKREIARFNNTLFGGDIESRGKVHPTQKPTKLIEWFFEKWGKDAKLIADIYLGSGSTLIACEKTNRVCFGMELDPHYVSVIIKRWQDYTGQRAVKL